MGLEIFTAISGFELASLPRGPMEVWDRVVKVEPRKYSLPNRGVLPAWPLYTTNYLYSGKNSGDAPFTILWLLRLQEDKPLLLDVQAGALRTEYKNTSRPFSPVSLHNHLTEWLTGQEILAQIDADQKLTIRLV